MDFDLDQLLRLYREETLRRMSYPTIADDIERSLRGGFEWHLPQRPQPKYKSGCPILEDK